MIELAILTRDPRRLITNMSAILSFQYKHGIVIASDGLAVYPKEHDDHTVDYVETEEFKISYLHSHAVIGVTGQMIATNTAKHVIADIRDELDKLERQPTLDEIAQRVIPRLKSTMRRPDSIIGALIAGYDFDEHGKPSSPQFITIYIDRDSECKEQGLPYFSAAREQHREYLLKNTKGMQDKGLLPLKTRRLANKYLTQLIKVYAAEDASIGGRLHAWNITKQGINEYDLNDFIPTSLTKGSKI